MSKRLPLLARVLVTFIVVQQSSNHRGVLTRGSCGHDFGNSTTALAIPDPTISWAFKHYMDCTQRAVWMNFNNPSANFKFYVGVGVPPVQRFASLRANALLIGPGLPPLSDKDKSSVPDEVLKDPVWKDGALGAILFKSPAEQSTCSHMGTVMQGHTSVVGDRCNFYEPFGSTNSWRVLDADENIIPNANAQYHVAVWLQEHTTGKIGIAMGTWKEDFRTPYNIITPECTRGVSDDFSEEYKGDQSSDFPYKSCTGTKVEGGSSNVGKDECSAGKVCTEKCEDVYVAKMGCCGHKCPTAVKLWDAVNMKMHMGMAVNFSGNPGLDFVRGMIPHHQGALDMCKVLIDQLYCQPWSDIDTLEGLMHFCNHVKLEQERELFGMRTWLAERSYSENSTCTNAKQMSMGCGQTTADSVKAYMSVNNKMHQAMAIKFSCNHSVDFVRGMMPHHMGAVGMCDVLANFSTAADEPYLLALCKNITRLQRAEVVWMTKWLAARGHTPFAHCLDCPSGARETPEPPCEDELSASSFCHRLGGDLMCKCADVVKEHACGTIWDVPGFATMNVSAQCMRTCGHCPAQRAPTFAGYECVSSMHNGHHAHGAHDMSSMSPSAAKCEHGDGHKGHGDPIPVSGAHAPFAVVGMVMMVLLSGW